MNLVHVVAGKNTNIVMDVSSIGKKVSMIQLEQIRLDLRKYDNKLEELRGSL